MRNSRPYSKTNQRFVMYIPLTLRQEIDQWVNKMDMTLAEFGREAFETYLSKKRVEERKAQLKETCALFETDNNHIMKEWAITEAESWSS